MESNKFPNHEELSLAAGIREIVNEFKYYQCCEEEGVEDMVVDARVLYELADELDEGEFEFHENKVDVMNENTIYGNPFDY